MPSIRLVSPKEFPSNENLPALATRPRLEDRNPGKNFPPINRCILSPSELVGEAATPEIKRNSEKGVGNKYFASSTLGLGENVKMKILKLVSFFLLNSNVGSFYCIF